MTRQELFDKWLPQFLSSDKARELGIYNAKEFHRQPGTYKAAEKILTCVDSIVKPCGSLGVQFKINSGYRCVQLNKAVGGEPDSYHTKALAVDIGVKYPSSINMLYTAFVGMALAREIEYDLIILEPNWVHWQVCLDDSKNRKLIKDLRGK